MSQHGGDIFTFAQEIGCSPSEVIDLSSNINFVQPKITLDFNKLNISAYPNYHKLEKAIAQLYKVKKSELELFNGATSSIHSLFRNLKLKTVVLYAPLYGEYKKVAQLYNYKIKLINRLETLNEEIPQNSLIIFVNPSTPDGHYYPLSTLMKKWIKKECTIVIDESFLDFTPFPSITSYLKSYKKLYIIKSMTKFYGSAGIRIGAVLSQKQNIEHLKEKEALWKISQFDSHYLQYALQDSKFKEKSFKKNLSNKKYSIKILKSLPFVKKIYPSSVNFLLIELKSTTAQELQNGLKDQKTMIRNCSNFDFLNNNFIRIAIKKKREVAIFKNKLKI